MKTLQLTQRYALAAGCLDLFTGACLVFQPSLTLRLMRVAALGDEATVFLQWVGAFVASVGASYLWALARGNRARLCTVLEITTVARLFVGVFSAFAVMRGWLGPAWISVPFTDLALAGVQIWFLRKLAHEHDSLG